MSWEKIALLAFYGYCALKVISQIGKPKTVRTTPASAILTILIFAVLATLVVLA